MTKSERALVLATIDTALANGWTYPYGDDAELVARFRAGTTTPAESLSVVGINGSVASMAGNFLVDHDLWPPS